MLLQSIAFGVGLVKWLGRHAILSWVSYKKKKEHNNIVIKTKPSSLVGTQVFLTGEQQGLN